MSIRTWLISTGAPFFVAITGKPCMAACSHKQHIGGNQNAEMVAATKLNLNFNDYYLYQGDTELFKVSYIDKSTLHMFNGQPASTQSTG